MKKLYLLFPILAGIMFGSTGVFVRTLTENGIDSTTLLFLRFSISIIYMLIAIMLTDKSLIKLYREDIPLYITCGLCILGLNLCYNNSINTVPLSLAAVLLSTAPVFVLIFAYFIFNEKITPIKVISVVLAIFGCVLTTGLIESNIASITPLGLLSGVGSAIFWALYTIASKKSIDRGKHTFSILFYSLIIITIVTIPFTDFGQISGFVMANPIENCIFLLMHSLISFSLPYIFITIALNHLEAGIVVILTSGESIAALVFGAIFYSEIPSALMFIGIIITIIALITLSQKTALET